LQELLTPAPGAARPFGRATNGIGTVQSVGSGVFHVTAGQRIALNLQLVADERAAEPAQILIGLTGMRASPAGLTDAPAKAAQAAWPDGGSPGRRD
jgi:alcohol dehydrogenase